MMRGGALTGKGGSKTGGSLTSRPLKTVSVALAYILHFSACGSTKSFKTTCLVLWTQGAIFTLHDLTQYEVLDREMGCGHICTVRARIRSWLFISAARKASVSSIFPPISLTAESRKNIVS